MQTRHTRLIRIRLGFSRQLPFALPNGQEPNERAASAKGARRRAPAWRTGAGAAAVAPPFPLPSSGAALSVRIPGWSGAPRQARHGGRPLRLGAGKRPPGRSATSGSGGFPTALLLRLQPLDPPEGKTLYVVSSQSGQRRFAGTLAGEERLQLRVEGKGEPRGFLSLPPRPGDRPTALGLARFFQAEGEDSFARASSAPASSLL